MGRFFIRRFFYSLLVICGVMFLTFLLFNLAAGDPAAAALGQFPQAPDELLRHLCPAEGPRPPTGVGIRTWQAMIQSTGKEM